MERARATVEALGLLGLPAAVLRRNGRILATNLAFDSLGEQFVFGAFDALSLANPAADGLFRQAVGHLDADHAAGGSRSIAIPALGDKPPMIAHLVPVRRAASDIFSRANSILVVTRLSAPLAPAQDILQGLFDLSPAETRVAQGVIRGDTVQVLARNMDLSPETIRTQLKAAMQKTGTSRQAELVGLLASATLAQPVE